MKWEEEEETFPSTSYRPTSPRPCG